jgi:tRNA threonylcarbamoyladenosine biosynthesis protein TsaE
MLLRAMTILLCVGAHASRLRTAPRRAPRAALAALASTTPPTGGAWRPDAPPRQRARWGVPSAAAAAALGRSLARLSKPGDVILLAGAIGMGKSTLARGFLKELTRDDALEVSSPSYLLDITYPDGARASLLPGVTAHHMDLWRLQPGQIGGLVELDTVFTRELALIEWPDRLGVCAPAAERCLLVELEPAHARQRGRRVRRRRRRTSWRRTRSAAPR